MSIEPFHTICDQCKSMGAEYQSHVIPCAECCDDVCQKCADVYDPDPPGLAVCKRCAGPQPAMP